MEFLLIMVNIKGKSQFELRIESIRSEYIKVFNKEPSDIFTSPGRVELLGNHTDHNHGKVMVSSVDLSIIALANKKDDMIVRYATNKYPLIEVDLSSTDMVESEKGNSASIIRGVAHRFIELGYKVGGFECSTSTTIFKGAGVSSSAAYELLVCQIFNHYYNNDSIPPIELAKISQYAESVYFGKPCGLLDQTGIALGGINYIDFNNIEKPYIQHLKYQFFKYDFVLINTKDSHSKMTPLYAEIINDMKKVATFYNKEYLREVKYYDFIKDKDEIIKQCGDLAYLRSKHFFEENKRVDEALEALYSHNENKFIQMMKESGDSSYYQLKNCFVSSEEENLPKTILLSKKLIKKGMVRVHGGGFAGTVLVAIDKSETQEYIKFMRKIYGFTNVRKVNLTRYGAKHVGKVGDYFHG